VSKKILTHVCCGPCATYFTKRLREKNFEIVGYYFNPNIYPREEYYQRLLTARTFFQNEQLMLVEGKYDPATHAKALKGETLFGKRCRECYRLRLQQTALKAVELGIFSFTTTLLISPYQNQVALREIGRRLARKYHLLFYEEDFVKGYKESRKMAREQGMYLQKYCGCGYSQEESAKIRSCSGNL